MFTHSQIWRALDRLALAHSTSPSGLAKMAGLDPTTFNKSKRQSGAGKDRWPSTESLAKVLDVLGITIQEFATLISEQNAEHLTAPLIGLAQAENDGYFDDAGFPIGGGWEEVTLPANEFDSSYALEISGDSMVPVFRPGEKIIVAPHERVICGDRVVVKTIKDEVLAKELTRMTEHFIELTSINPDYPPRLIARKDILWMARIVWVSQ